MNLLNIETPPDGTLMILNVDDLTVIGMWERGGLRPLTEMEGDSVIKAWEDKLVAEGTAAPILNKSHRKKKNRRGKR